LTIAISQRGKGKDITPALFSPPGAVQVIVTELPVTETFLRSTILDGGMESEGVAELAA
jgi:hypothetical protein